MSNTIFFELFRVLCNYKKIKKIFFSVNKHLKLLESAHKCLYFSAAVSLYLKELF